MVPTRKLEYGFDNHNFFHTRPAFDAPDRGGGHWNIAKGLIRKTRMVWLPDSEKILRKCLLAV